MSLNTHFAPIWNTAVTLVASALFLADFGDRSVGAEDIRTSKANEVSVAQSIVPSALQIEIETEV